MAGIEVALGTKAEHTKPEASGIEGLVMDENMQASFSIHDFDEDGDKIDHGVFLHFGGTRIKVAKNKSQLKAFKDRLNSVIDEVIDESGRYE